MFSRKKLLSLGLIFLVVGVMVGFVIDGIGKKNKPVINEQKNSIVNDVKKEIKTDEVVANEDNFMGIKKMLSYQNNVYGIEFQYPTSWSADMMMTKLKPNSQEDCKNSDCQMAVSVSVIKNEEKLTLKQYLDKNLEIYKNVKEVKVGDAVAYTATVVDSATSSENVAFIVQANDGNFFKLQGIALAGGEKEVLNQMISSFKFIEPVK